MSDKEYAYLASLGYTGSLADKRRAYYDNLILNGGEPDIPITGEYIPNRELWTSTSVTTVSQRLFLMFFTARNTETITTATCYTAGTAAGATPTFCGYGLYSVDSTTEDLTLITSTANDTTLFASTNTAYPKAFQASWSKVAGQRYAIGHLVVTAAAAPVFHGQGLVSTTVVNALFLNKPRLCGYLAAQTSFPSSITASGLTSTGSRFGFYLS